MQILNKLLRGVISTLKFETLRKVNNNNLLKRYFFKRIAPLYTLYALDFFFNSQRDLFLMLSRSLALLMTESWYQIWRGYVNIWLFDPHCHLVAIISITANCSASIWLEPYRELITRQFILIQMYPLPE